MFLIKKFISNNINEMNRRFFVRSDSETRSIMTESKVISEKNISIKDVIKGKNIKFYLDGNQI